MTIETFERLAVEAFDKPAWIVAEHDLSIDESILRFKNGISHIRVGDILVVPAKVLSPNGPELLRVVVVAPHEIGVCRGYGGSEIRPIVHGAQIRVLGEK